jgi:tetratricopeptide (TPR) repeat protein
MTTLLKANPNVTRYQAFWGDCTFNLGVLQQETCHSSEAQASYLQALKSREAMASANPGVVAHQKNLADTLHGLGELQRETGHEPEAFRSFQRALMIREALAAGHPSLPVHQNDLAKSLTDIGTVERRLGHAEEALRLHVRAGGISATLIAMNPENLEYRSSSGASYDQAGMDLVALNRQNEAEDEYRHALENLHAAYDKAPEVTRNRRLLSEHLQHFATLLRSMSRRSEAASLILERRKLWPGNPGELYKAALELAACIPPTGPGQVEPSPTALAEHRKHSDWAMDAIREALDAGFNDVGRLQSDNELDPLRSRTDLKAIISDLVFPSNPFAR